MSTIAPNAATPLEGSAAAVIAFRARGQLRMTVIAKTTFAFAPETKMARAEVVQPILRAEVHHGQDPARSVRFTSDLAPYLGRADVLFTGDAFAPGASPLLSLPVRLAIVDRDRTILDKRLLVQDRSGFLRMSILYERTWSGVAFLDNPVGIDATTGADDANIVDPARPMQPAGFGPIARAWPLRKRLLGSTPRKALEAPIAEIPPDFDSTYFQAAPLDQRIDHLRGDEWLVLEGLHPTLPRLWTRLPGARGKARIFGLSTFGMSEGQELELHADTLRIDGEEQCCTVVWRRSFPIPNEAALVAARIVAGVEIDGEEIAWPAPSLDEGHHPTPEPTRSVSQRPALPAMVDRPVPGARVRAADLTLEQCAAIAVELAERRASQAEVLGGHGLSEACWAEAEGRWTRAMDEEAVNGGGRALRDAYDAAYVAAWRGLKGPFELSDYGRVMVAAEQGKLSETLSMLGIRRTVWMRLLRVLHRRIAADPSLAALLEGTLAALRTG